ncbi:TPA: hypothetical protein P4F45_005260, partial [Escherichia coli]|nr:hypothetical protein [Escherichia coli]
MKERGVVFNDDMVRAILEGRKTQTRRPVKNVRADNCLVIRKPTKKRNGVYTHVMDAPEHGLCPFGNVGDRIWVREAWAILGNEDGCSVDWNDNLCRGDEKNAARIYRAS